MSLSSRITALADRIGLEVKAKIGASHPGVARAWVCFGYVSNQVVLRAAHNVATVTRSAAGRYRVRFSVAMPDTQYCWVALARSSVDSGTQRLAVIRASADAKTTQYVDVSCATTSTSFADSSEINLVVYR